MESNPIGRGLAGRGPPAPRPVGGRGAPAGGVRGPPAASGRGNPTPVLRSTAPRSKL